MTVTLSDPAVVRNIFDLSGAIATPHGPKVMTGLIMNLINPEEEIFY